MPMISGGAAPMLQPLMLFIDGAYLRTGIKRLGYSDKQISFTNLSSFTLSSAKPLGNIYHYLVRAYYYDSLPNEKELANEYADQVRYLEWIRTSTNFYDIKLGRLKSAKGGNRQKGVDVLLAVDMITKAHENQYDAAALIAGDDDFLDVIKAVKETGKRVYGIYFDGQISKDLKDNFDMRIPITKENIRNSSLMLEHEDNIFSKNSDLNKH